MPQTAVRGADRAAEALSPCFVKRRPGLEAFVFRCEWRVDIDAVRGPFQAVRGRGDGVTRGRAGGRCDFSGHKHVLARVALAQRGAEFGLVVVRVRGVEMPDAGLERQRDGRLGLFRCGFVEAKPNSRYGDAAGREERLLVGGVRGQRRRHGGGARGFQEAAARHRCQCCCCGADHQNGSRARHGRAAHSALRAAELKCVRRGSPCLRTAKTRCRTSRIST